MGTPRVDYGGQGGFGDVALSPDFANDGIVYLSWAEAGEGDTRGAAVGRARLVIGPGAQGGRLEGLQVIWRQEPKTTGRGHYSHRLAFSPDGRFLFIAAGDRQKITPAQDPDQLLGKIVRLTPTGGIPSDNPNYDQGRLRAQWWSTGHRNILGMAFDAEGRLWEVEHGPAGGDELNLVKRGANYGWPSVEGNNGNPPSSPGTYQAPLHVYSHGNNSNQGYVVTGGAFYNPTTVNFPSEYVGDYFFADYASGWIRKLDLPNTSGSNFIRDILGPIDLRVASDGSLWYLARGYGTNTGEVWRVTYTDSSAPSISQHPASLTRSEGQSATFTVVASGAQPLSYQWQRDGVNIPGANSASYTLNSVTLNDNGGTFRCLDKDRTIGMVWEARQVAA